MENSEIVVEFIKKYFEIEKKYIYLKKYIFNLIEECGANENAHSRILSCLLRYKKSNEYVFLEKFISLLNDQLKYNSKDDVVISYEKNKLDIRDQWQYIDIFIRIGNQAIIIENKIKWAGDQEGQIERYIETSMTEVGSSENCFVVYLTDTPDKIITDFSFTDKAKQYLGYNGENQKGRFISINYRDHILPLLRDFIKIIEFKDMGMIAGIYQYIDYFDGRYGVREGDKEYMEKISEDLLKFICDNNNEFAHETSHKKKYDFLEVLGRNIVNVIDNLKNSVYPVEERPYYYVDKLRDRFSGEADTSLNCDNYRFGIKVEKEGYCYKGDSDDGSDSVCLSINVDFEEECKSYTFSIGAKRVEANNYCSIDSDIFEEKKQYFSEIAGISFSKDSEFSSCIKSSDYNFIDFDTLKSQVENLIKGIKSLRV